MVLILHKDMGIYQYYAIQSTIYFIKLCVNVPLKRRCDTTKNPRAYWDTARGRVRVKNLNFYRVFFAFRT